MAYEQDVRAAIDAAAAEHSNAIEIPSEPAAETTLAIGAEGDCVTKLVGLLALLGYATNDVIAGKSSQLDQSVITDLVAAEAALGFHELPGDELLEPAEIPVGVKGRLVTATTWDALYAAAAEKVPLPADAAAADATQA